MKKIALVLVLFVVSITINAQKILQANIYYQTATGATNGAAKFHCLGSNESLQYSTYWVSMNDTSMHATYSGDSIYNLGEGICSVIAESQITGDTIGTMQFYILSPSTMLGFFCFNLKSIYILNSVTNTTCDGSVFFNQVGIYGSGSYYLKGENGISQVLSSTSANLDSFTVEHLCPGKYLIYAFGPSLDTNLFFLTTFWIDAEINNPVNMHVDVNTVSTSNSCTGKAFAQVNQGNPPYTYHWIGFSSVVTDSITGLCEGIYTLMVVDNNLDSAAVNYFIASDNNTFDNTNNTGYTASDTLFSYIQNCTIDYNVPIDSSYITSYSLLPDSMNLAYVLSVWQNGVLTELHDTLSLDSMNVNMFIIYIYCPAKSSANVIKVVDYVNVDKLSTVNNIKNDNQFTVYPNPAEKTIYIKTSEFLGSNIEIMNVDGKLLQQINLKSGVSQIPIDDLPSGIYFVKLRTLEDVFVRKFIKNN